MAEYRKYAWWEIQAIPDHLIKEIRRRSKNYGLNYPSGGTEMLNGNFDNYKGPLRTWVRFTSNGNAKPVNNALVPLTPLLSSYSSQQTLNERDEITTGANGFVLQGGDGFFSAYGVDPKTFKKTEPIIGYDVDGKPYKLPLNSYYDGSWKQSTTTINGTTYKFPQLSDSPTLLPQPGITGISVKQNGELILEAEINITCYSLAQVEFLTPFFFTPGISTLLEFGYHIFNQKSLINISTNSLKNENGALAFFIPGGREKTYFHTQYSNGNYGVIAGIITNYSMETSDGLKYECRVNLISGQALYAGQNIKNSIEKDEDDATKIIPSFKSFLTYVLQSLEGCVSNKDGSNLISYLQANSNIIQTDAGSTQNNLNNTNITDTRKRNQAQSDINEFLLKRGKNPQVFYNGQKEDRIFMGRKPTIDASHLWPNKTKEGDYTKIFDKDFDSGNQNRIFIQLDLFFELLNFFFKDDQGIVFNGIDVDTNPLSAHVNLISCNSDVLLIPNTLAPKINKGEIGGFLTAEQSDDAFVKQVADNEFDENDLKGEKASLLKAFQKAKKVFKQNKIYRDNHDVVLNKFFYGLNPENTNQKGYETEANENGQPKLIDRNLGSAAFPQAKDCRFRKDGQIYKAYTYGFLKHLYVNIDLIINACENSSITTVKELLVNILPRINSAVNNYWELDITMGDNRLQIVDKNLINKSNITNNIYMFDIGNNKGLFKQISFNTSLVDEQTNQIIFGGNLNQSPTDTTTQASVDTLVPLRYGDRIFDATRADVNEAIGESNLPQPKVDIENNPAAQLQIRAAATGDGGVLLMTYIKPLPGFDANNPEEPKPDNLGKTYNINYKALSLNQINSNLLTSILTDKDIENNVGIYSQVNPNLVLTVTLEGIYGFEMFQHFAISNLPRPYVPGNIIFMITEVNHIVQSGMWETAITALPRCIAGENINYITV